ncbi:sulfatase-like hydrolase/transferase [Candidatus Halobonum tyrrellensis]|uniref:Sulfatase n=1 Tax=Candidatus Halobonum tyrrellensis G22 TaxID=1324957 RepID=V4GXX3_9EURY|nr:sulfatase-like hydrolase/transferase [Candidatus Halobonum tyrrellensis]ESP90016.1 sulfatase [Candidatus Halobonum tyrrellensis G22]
MRNVVLICLDTVRKDFFDSNAKRIKDSADVDVRQCRATSAWSAPSHAGMFTGELPHQHGVHTYQRSFNGIPEEGTFLSKLPEHTLLGASANTFAGPPFNFNQRFDKFRYFTSPSHRYTAGLNPVSYNNGTLKERYGRFLRDALRSDHPIASLLNGAIGVTRQVNRHTPFKDIFDDGAKPLLNEARGMVNSVEEPYFLFLNLMDAHLPLTPHRNLRDHEVPSSWSTHSYDQWEYFGRRDEFEEYWRYRESLYAAVIEYLDRVVSEFVKYVTSRSAVPTSVIVTADHGENLGRSEEGGLVNHTSSLSEGLLHVPFSIINPGDIIPSPENRVVSHLDMPDVVSALAKGQETFEWDAIPRAEVMGMGPNPDPPSKKEFWDRTIRCVYEDMTKYVWDTQGTEAVYKLKHGKPSWQREVDGPFELPPELESLFKCDIAAARDQAFEEENSATVSKSTESRLEELGYL